MSDMTFRARSLPYREPRPGTYTCQRCGIELPRNGGHRAEYCPDCRIEALALGWTRRINERKAA